MSSNNYDYLSDLFIDEVKDLPGPGGGKPSEDTRFLDFVEGKMTELTDAEITTIGDYGFYYNHCITKVDLPNLVYVGEEAFCNASIKSLSAPQLEYVTAKSAFSYCNSLTQVNLPNLVMRRDFSQSGFRLFGYCGSLETISLPKLKFIPQGCFSDCKKLVSVDLPNAEMVSMSAFSSCSKLVSLRLPKVTSINTSSNAAPVVSYASMLEDLYVPMIDKLTKYFCYNCYKLKSLDLFVASSIDSQAFKNDYSFKSLFLRKEDAICTLANVDTFTNCYHFHGTVDATYNPDGLKDGYIYVPRALIEDYKVATNWVTFADQFRALEDYTVDGTTTGEMDWDKINGGATT